MSMARDRRAETKHHPFVHAPPDYADRRLAAFVCCFEPPTAARGFRESRGWFKRVGRNRVIGEIRVRHFLLLEQTKTRRGFRESRGWFKRAGRIRVIGEIGVWLLCLQSPKPDAGFANHADGSSAPAGSA
jgi:hypothetical protein